MGLVRKRTYPVHPFPRLPDAPNLGVDRCSRRGGSIGRLAVDFAREQIDATTLPILSLEDLVDVGLSTADAERVVAAVAPSDPVAAPASEGGVPENLCCPISMEIMEQPVLAADGFTYDRHAIEAWLARGKTTSPTTGAPLAHTMLTPNHLVKSMIAEYQESKG